MTKHLGKNNQNAYPWLLRKINEEFNLSPMHL